MARFKRLKEVNQMILNSEYIRKFIWPKIKKALLWITLLLVGFLSLITFILIRDEMLSYMESFIILSSISLLFIIPIYVIYIKKISYLKRLSKFIKTHQTNSELFNNIKIFSYENLITLEKLLFIPISCKLDNEEKLYYFPYGILDIDTNKKSLDVLISDRFIVGVKDAH